MVSLGPLAKCGLEAEAAAGLDSSMTKLDFKSAAIGFLSATTLVACVAASGSSNNQTGPYRLIVDGKGLLKTFDTRTGMSYISYTKGDLTDECYEILREEGR